MMPYQGPIDRFITFIWTHRDTSIWCRVLCWIDTEISCFTSSVGEWWEYWPNRMAVGMAFAAVCYAVAAMGFILAIG